jgi:hypothetical protein
MTSRRLTTLFEQNLRARMKAVIQLELNLRHMGRMKPRIYHAMKAKAQLHHQNHNDAKNGHD